MSIKKHWAKGNLIFVIVLLVLFFAAQVYYWLPEILGLAWPAAGYVLVVSWALVPVLIVAFILLVAKFFLLYEKAHQKKPAPPEE